MYCSSQSAYCGVIYWEMGIHEWQEKIFDANARRSTNICSTPDDTVSSVFPAAVSSMGLCSELLSLRVSDILDERGHVSDRFYTGLHKSQSTAHLISKALGRPFNS